MCRHSHEVGEAFLVQLAYPHESEMSRILKNAADTVILCGKEVAGSVIYAIAWSTYATDHVNIFKCVQEDECTRIHAVYFELGKSMHT